MESLDVLHERILIVDDEPTNNLLLERILARAGYTNVRSVTDPRAVPPLFDGFRPDLLLLDLIMPDTDGFQVMEQLQPRLAAERYFPILAITADTTPETKRRALAGGAKG
jgi:putative two-component system response regulator